jgi:hypothetical protein
MSQPLLFRNKAVDFCEFVVNVITFTKQWIVLVCTLVHIHAMINTENDLFYALHYMWLPSNQLGI